MPDDVVLRFTTQGAQEAAADVDKVRNSAAQLGPTVERSSAQADAGMQRASTNAKDYGYQADKARAAAAAAAAAADKAASGADSASTSVNRAGRSVDVATQRSSRGISDLADGVRMVGGVSPAVGHVANILDGLAASSLGAAGGLQVTTVAAEGEAVAATTAAGATTLLSFALGGIPLILSLVATGLSIFNARGSGAKNVTDELTDAIIRDTEALSGNTDAVNENVGAYYTKQLRDLAPDLNKAGILFSEVTTAVSGTDAQFGALIAKAGAMGSGSADLTEKLFGLRSEFQVAAYYEGEFAAAGGIAAGSMEDAADAASKYASAIDNLLNTRPGGGAERDLAAEQDKLQELLKDDGSKEYAQRQRDAAKAQSDATRATEAREAAERKLAEVNRRNLADERERAEIERDRAEMSVEQAKVALAEAELHQQRVGAAGGSEKAASEADRAVREGRLKVREATKSATDAEAKYNDVASGAALERDRAAAVRAVADARAAEQDATAKLGKALEDARVPASKLGATSKEIADQVDRVVRAAVAANVALIPMLDGLGTRFPQIADAVERIVAAVRSVNDNPGLITGARVGDPGPGAPGGPAFNPNARASGGPVGGYEGLRRYLVGERGPEVLDMYARGGGYVYANTHPLTRSVLGRAAGGDVGFGSRASVSGYAGGGAQVLVVEKTTREGDITGPISVSGADWKTIERGIRSEQRRRASSRVSRGR